MNIFRSNKTSPGTNRSSKDGSALGGATFGLNGTVKPIGLNKTDAARGALQIELAPVI